VEGLFSDLVGDYTQANISIDFEQHFVVNSSQLFILLYIFMWFLLKLLCWYSSI